MSSEVLFKVLIIGDALVGKTSFVQRYVHGNSRREYKPTIGGIFDPFHLFISMIVSFLLPLVIFVATCILIFKCKIMR